MQNRSQVDLPTYSSYSVRGISSAAASSIFSVDPQRFEHVFHLERKGTGHKWLSLYVRSRSKSGSAPPVFLEGDEIAGRVELHLEGPEVIKEVIVKIQGSTTAVGQEELVFLDMTQSVWTPDPRKKNSDKLEGHQSWNFSMNLPREAIVSQLSGFGSDSRSKNKSRFSGSSSQVLTFILPPNFSERASPAYIDYKLIVIVKRGTFKANQVLSPYFAYIPKNAPPPFSRLRQRAYRANTSLVGPEGDPEGWKVIGPIPIRGTAFNTRQVEVRCTLAIGIPLSYPVKSNIPFILTLNSNDPDDQVLDILSLPSAIRMFLVRTIVTGSDAICEDDMAKRKGNNVFKERVGQAVFWPRFPVFEGGNPGRLGRRQVEGELEIRQGLKPSFIFPRLSIRYSIDFLPFEAPGFVLSIPSSQSPSSVDREVLHSEPITITTQPAPGPKSRSYAPPGYDRPLGGGATGILENGNRQFYHKAAGTS